MASVDRCGSAGAAQPEGVPRGLRPCEGGECQSERLFRAFRKASRPGHPVWAIARPVDQLVREADQRLEIVVGAALEKLAGQLYQERSRKAVGDFPLTQRIQGYGDKAGAELDLVAVNDMEKIIWLS